MFIGRTDAEAEAPILWPPDVKNWLTGKDSDAGKDWGQEEKGTTEDEMIGWHHWLDGWIWKSSGSQWWTGKPSVLQSMGSWRVRHDWATELNWTELSQSYGFSNSPVWMWELDYKESWAPKSWFWTVVLEKTLESPLDCKEIQPVHLKGNQSWIFIGRTDAEAETLILWPLDVKNWLIWKDPDAGKEWRLEEKGITEDEMIGWHHWFNGHEFE